jgi:SHS2 domain-containing protein
MPYKLTDRHTSSDIGLEASGRSAEELFIDSALGMIDIMAERDSLDESRVIEIDINSDSLDELYFDWFSEIIYFKDAEYFMPKRIEIQKLDIEKFKLKARLLGETITPSKHILKVDVKAVTRYKFKIQFIRSQWRGEVVFDL